MYFLAFFSVVASYSNLSTYHFKSANLAVFPIYDIYLQAVLTLYS